MSKLVDCFKMKPIKKLDGVGPVDNRPSPAKLHHFVRETDTFVTAWLTDSVILCQNILHCLSQTVRARELKFRKNVNPPTTDPILHVACDISHKTF